MTHTPRTSRTPRKHRRPLLEPLEPRQLLSATFLNAFGFGTTALYGESITGMATDSAGNVIVAGYFAGTMDIDPSPAVQNIVSTTTTSYDMFLIKYSATGAVLWANTFGSSGNDMAGAVMVDAADNIFLTGSFNNTLDMDPGIGVNTLTSNGGSDALVAKYDASGNFLWARSFGGTGDDTAAKITSDHHGGFLVAGNFQNTADLDPGTASHLATASTLFDCYLSHFNASGNLTWADQFTAPINLYFANIAADSSGNVYVAGMVQGACDFNPGTGTKLLGDPSQLDGFAAKFTSAGKLTWAKQFGGPGGILMADMTLDAQQNLVLVGSFGGTADFDPGTAVHSLTEHQSPDAFTGFVLKLTNAGAYKWAGALTGDSWSDAFAVTADTTGNVYVTGEYNGTNTFDITGQGPNSDTLTSRGQDDAFLAKYDSTGRLAWVQPMGSPGYDHGFHVAVGPANTIYTSGYFTDTAHFGPLAAGTDLVALSNQDSFIAVFNQATPEAPVVTLTAVPASASKWHNITFTLTVTPTAGIPTGAVLIMQGTRVVARGTVGANGQTIFHVLGMASGLHNLNAVYKGDANFAPSTSTLLALTVAPPP